jgi:hypothetical protein
VADGFFHSFSGWVMYIVAFLMLFAVGWAIDRFGRKKDKEASTILKTAVTGAAKAREIVLASEPSLAKGTE